MLTNGIKDGILCLQQQWVTLGNILKHLELDGVGVGDWVHYNPQISLVLDLMSISKRNFSGILCGI